MANWFDEIIESRLHDAEDLQTADLEKRFSATLDEILGLLNEGRIEDAKVLFRILQSNVKFGSDFSPVITNLHKRATLTIQVKEIRSNNLLKPGKNIIAVLKKLTNIEQQAQDIPDVLALIEECRNQLLSNNARPDVQPRTRILTPLNIGVFVVLIFVSISTIGLENKFDLRNWIISLNAEFVGATFTFVLLTLVFENTRNRQEKNQEMRQIQYKYYEELRSSPNLVSRQEIIDRMKIEDMLQRAYLVYLNWDGINLKGCNLKGANLSFGRGIDQAICDETTILPNGKQFVVGSNLEVTFDPFINPKR